MNRNQNFGRVGTTNSIFQPVGPFQSGSATLKTGLLVHPVPIPARETNCGISTTISGITNNAASFHSFCGSRDDRPYLSCLNNE